MTALEYVHEHMNFRSNKAMLSTSNPADDSTLDHSAQNNKNYRRV
jgi:hypothetical protein